AYTHGYGLSNNPAFAARTMRPSGAHLDHDTTLPHRSRVYDLRSGLFVGGIGEAALQTRSRLYVHGCAPAHEFLDVGGHERDAVLARQQLLGQSDDQPLEPALQQPA